MAPRTRPTPVVTVGVPRRRRAGLIRRTAVAGLALVLLAACAARDDGVAATTADPNPDTDPGPRTIHIDMVDIAFEPDVVRVSPGERVTFVFTNTGEVLHEAVIGDEAAQAAHGEWMEAGQGHGQGHGQSNGHDDSSASIEHLDQADVASVQLGPGERGSLLHEVGAEPDDQLIACHLPGHFEAGMQIRIEVG